MKRLISVLVALFLFTVFWMINLANGLPSFSVAVITASIIFLLWVSFAVKRESIISIIVGFLTCTIVMYLIWAINILVAYILKMDHIVAKILSMSALIAILVTLAIIVIIKIKKRIFIVPTNKILIIQGLFIQGLLRSGFYTSNESFKDVEGYLGKTFIKWFNFLYKFEKDDDGNPIFHELPTKIQVIKLEKKVNGEEVKIEAVTKDDKPIGVKGSLEFQIQDPMKFYNRLWSKTITGTLEEAQAIFSLIIETHIEPVVRTYLLDVKNNNTNGSDSGPSIDQLKSEIAKNTLNHAYCRSWNNSQDKKDYNQNLTSENNSQGEFYEYGAKLVNIHITDWTGSAIEKFRENAEQIQLQENESKLSDQKKETAIRKLDNEEKTELRKQEKLQKIADAKKTTNQKVVEALKELKLGNAKIDAEVFKEIKVAQEEHKELFLKTDPIVALQTIVEKDAGRFPELRTMLNSGSDSKIGVVAEAMTIFKELFAAGFKTEDLSSVESMLEIESSDQNS